MFAAQAAALRGRYRVLTLDLRGHGDSQPMGQAFTVPQASDDLVAILDELGLRRVILVGQLKRQTASQSAIRPDVQAYV
jgi:pimeloyl-ACP methyl ester carboxylesterase